MVKSADHQSASYTLSMGQVTWVNIVVHLNSTQLSSKELQGQTPTLTRQSPTVRVSLPEIFLVSSKDTFTYLTMGIISTSA